MAGPGKMMLAAGFRSRSASMRAKESAMPSPFPGMDPYLEQEILWHDFHEKFIPAAAAYLTRRFSRGTSC